MRLLAPAKINLHLRVGPPMADGFHPLLTWMCTVGLCDTMDVSVHSAGERQVFLECDDPSLPTDGRNLVVRAGSAFLDAFGLSASVRVRLNKAIPTGGGLGGGSSDAATMLLGLKGLFGQSGTEDVLHRLAASLGSDVPFFLHGPSSVCVGRGEVVQPIGRPAARWALLIVPSFGVSTAQAYRQFDAMGLGHDLSSPQPDWADWCHLPTERLLERLVNDLEPAAFAVAPVLAVIREECERQLSRPVRMSGSGSTLFSLYDRGEEAKAAADKIRTEELKAVAVELANN